MPQYVDATLCVVEPYFKSLKSGRRIAALAGDLGIEHFALVADKICDEHELVASRPAAPRWTTSPPEARRSWRSTRSRSRWGADNREKA